MRIKIFDLGFIIPLLVILLTSCVGGHDQQSDSVAFQPENAHSSEFASAFKASTITVYPSIVRSYNETSYYEASQDQIVAYLNNNGFTSAVAKKENIKLAQLEGRSQWAFFNNDMSLIKDALNNLQQDADYSLVMTFIMPPGKQTIFGIQCYILNKQGDNVFSFLLNSHHKLYKEAQLQSNDHSESVRVQLVDTATQVGLDALIQLLNKTDDGQKSKPQGYEITSQNIGVSDNKPQRIFVLTTLHEQLIPTYMHSLKHSLMSAFEANGVTTSVKFFSADKDGRKRFKTEIHSFKPDAILNIDIKPLYRQRKDDYQAIIGTLFDAKLADVNNTNTRWKASGKVDYIQMFGKNYTAHEGIRKEFAWHTTAAIVRAYMMDVNGHPSKPIYTDTETRQINGQRTD